MKVSIPYRYYKNKARSKNRERGPEVSIPYRYYKNSEIQEALGHDESSFNSL